MIVKSYFYRSHPSPQTTHLLVNGKHEPDSCLLQRPESATALRIKWIIDNAITY